MPTSPTRTTKVTRIATLVAALSVAGALAATPAGAAEATEWTVHLDVATADADGLPILGDATPLPAGARITVESEGASQTCAVVGAGLDCTTGFAVRRGATYQVHVSALPAGTTARNTGTFTTEQGTPGTQCTPNHGGVVGPCRHIVTFAPVAAGSLAVVTTPSRGAGTVSVRVDCEAPAVTASGVEVSAATSDQLSMDLAPATSARHELAGLEAGTECTIIQTETTSGDLAAVTGGSPVHATDGTLVGVSVTIPSGGTVAATLTTSFDTTSTSVGGASVARTGATDTSTATGDSPGEASTGGATVVAGTAGAGNETVDRAVLSDSTTTSNAGLSLGGGDLILVLSGLGMALCGAAAYGLVRTARREAAQHQD